MSLLSTKLVNQQRQQQRLIAITAVIKPTVIGKPFAMNGFASDSLRPFAGAVEMLTVASATVVVATIELVI